MLRTKDEKGVYRYYLSKFKDSISFLPDPATPAKKKSETSKSFHERDLHPLLVTFLDAQGILAKTIYHEQSNKNEEHQKWLHPDIIGVHFVEHSNKVCQNFFRATNKEMSVEIYSYELKKGISSDSDLKRCYFQAVSNSSWANYGFLVFLEFDLNLQEELERLNESFGIGAILIKPNPYESKILFPARRKNLDFKTINKLCNINEYFKLFFEQIEKLITADPKYTKDVKKGLSDLCDKALKNETEITAYCQEKHILTDEEEQ